MPLAEGFVRNRFEFEKGKNAIAVPSLDKVPMVIDILITAVRNGELDRQLAQAKKPETVLKCLETVNNLITLIETMTDAPRIESKETSCGSVKASSKGQSNENMDDKSCGDSSRRIATASKSPRGTAAITRGHAPVP
jgi:hypothetical protein